MSDKYDKKPTHCYVGFAPCGCAWSIMTDDGKKAAPHVAEIIRSGQYVERHEWEEAHKLFQAGQKCSHTQETEKKGPLL